MFRQEPALFVFMFWHMFPSSFLMRASLWDVSFLAIFSLFFNILYDAEHVYNDVQTASSSPPSRSHPFFSKDLQRFVSFSSGKLAAMDLSKRLAKIYFYSSWKLSYINIYLFFDNLPRKSLSARLRWIIIAG